VKVIKESMLQAKEEVARGEHQSALRTAATANHFLMTWPCGWLAKTKKMKRLLLQSGV
jgi:hypothetical protein